MPGFASRFLTDEVAFLADGITNASLGAAGTRSGTPMIWGGTPAQRWRKIGFILSADSGGSVTFYLMTATASAGAFATFASANNTASSATMTPTAPKNILYAEARGEMLTDLGTRGYWIRPVIVQAGTVAATALVTLGFLVGNAPAKPDPAVGVTFFPMM